MIIRRRRLGIGQEVIYRRASEIIVSLRSIVYQFGYGQFISIKGGPVRLDAKRPITRLHVYCIGIFGLFSYLRGTITV